MECSPPRGFPEPVVSWKKDGRELRPGDDARVTVHSSGNLIITDVRSSDTGFYTCVATNMVGSKVSENAFVVTFHAQTLPGVQFRSSVSVRKA